MTELGLPLVYALLVWWFSTGLILFLDSLPEWTFRWSMLGATVVAGAGFYGIAAGIDAATPGQAYLAFTGGLLIWGWLEMAYLMGFVTGTWTRPCPEGLNGWPRFVLAVKTSIYHELSIVAAGVALFALTWGEPNQLAAWTFLVLWLMRWSSKLNIFFGVANLNEEFLPEQLGYLTTFIRPKSINWLFPVSVTIGAIVAAGLIERAVGAVPGSYAAAESGLLAALVVLGTLEHWFLVLPFEDAALWRWALKPRGLDERIKETPAPPARIGSEQPTSANCG